MADHPVNKWNKCYEFGRDFRFISPKALTRILSFLPDSAPRVCLDVGCGTGQLTREIHHRGFDCVGIDLSATAVKLARSLTVRSGIKYVVGDIERVSPLELGLSKYSCGIVTCKYVFAFIINKEELLQRVKSLLASDGIFVLISPTFEHIERGREHIAIDANSTNTLLRKHFETVNHFQEGEVTTFICKGLNARTAA